MTTMADKAEESRVTPRAGASVVRVEREITVARPTEEVFAHLVDLDGYTAWMPRTGLFGSCRPVEGASGEADVTYRDSSRIGPWRGRMTALPPTRVEFRQTLRWFGRDVMEARLTYLLERRDGMTEVRHVAEGELHGIFRIMRPITAVLARRERRLLMEALEAALERANDRRG